MWIGLNKDQIRLPMDQTSDSVWTNYNFVCELGQIMTRYDLLGARRVNLSNIQTDSNLDQILILVNFSYELGQ